jgi:hypothetical protein
MQIYIAKCGLDSLHKPSQFERPIYRLRSIVDKCDQALRFIQGFMRVIACVENFPNVIVVSMYGCRSCPVRCEAPGDSAPDRCGDCTLRNTSIILYNTLYWETYKETRACGKRGLDRMHTRTPVYCNVAWAVPVFPWRTPNCDDRQNQNRRTDMRWRQNIIGTRQYVAGIFTHAVFGFDQVTA